jgi:hypothetical protein
MQAAHATLLDDHVAAKKPLAVSFDHRRQAYLLQFDIFRVGAHQHDTRDRASPTNDQITEILVLGEQKPFLAQCQRNNVRVAETRSNFRDVENVVSGRAQRSNQGSRDAFVSEPAHVSAVDDVFVGGIISGKSQRGVDIVMHQPRVIDEE